MLYGNNAKQCTVYYGTCIATCTMYTNTILRCFLQYMFLGSTVLSSLHDFMTIDLSFVCSVEFYDELIKAESSVDVGGGGGGEGEGEREDDTPPQMADFSVKALKLTGLSIELDSEHVQDVKPSQSLDGTYMYMYSVHIHVHVHVIACSTELPGLEVPEQTIIIT